MKSIQLKVAEAISDDVGKGLIRIDAPFMKEIGVEEGDIVVIKGSRITYARLAGAYPGDSMINITRIDKFIRVGAGVEIGEMVKIYKYLKVES